MSPADHFQLRVEGHLDPHWAEWFGDLTLRHEPDGTTTLTGVVADQAQLHGVLARVRDLGVELVSVNRVGGLDTVAARPTRPPNPGARLTNPGT